MDTWKKPAYWESELWSVASMRELACRVADGRHDAAFAARFARVVRDAANYLLVACESRQVFCPLCGQRKTPDAATCDACRVAQQKAERLAERLGCIPPKPNVDSVLTELIGAPSCPASSNTDETQRPHYRGSPYDPSCHVADARRSLRLSDEEKDSDGEPDDVNALLNAPDNQDDDSP